MSRPGCLDRKRQVLLKLEDAGCFSLTDLRDVIESTSCHAGHELRLADFDPDHLAAVSDGQLQVTAAGREWVLEADRPARHWERTVAVGAPLLRAWQVEALNAWCGHGRHGVVEAVTGTGKSRVGIEAAREALAHDYNIVVAVPTVDLVEQWVKALKANRVAKVGALGDGNRADFRTHDVVVGTVQSLYHDPPSRPDGKVLLIADECHRYGAGQWRKALDESYRRRLGLTATFERNDDGLQRLLAYFGGEPVFKIGFKRAIADGVVAHYDVQLLGVALDSRERSEYEEADRVARDARIQLLAADFPAEPFGAFLHEVQKAAEDEWDPTISDVARRYLKAFSKRIDVMTGARAKLDVASEIADRVSGSGGAIVFTRRVEMAEELAERLVEGGVRAEPIHSDLSRTQRKNRLAALRAGRLKALVAPTILDEGIDVPDIDLAVVMGGSRSRRQMIQRMGRVLRLKPDGRKATFIVVYAEGTAEDLSVSDGTEGCLDLIVESADRVEPLTLERDQAVPSELVYRRNTDHSVDAANEGKPAPGPSESEVEHLPVDLAVIDPASCVVGPAALRSYRRAHGGDAKENESALRRLLHDLLLLGEAKPSTKRRDTVVLSSSGFDVAVTSDGVFGYRSNRDDALTWDDLIEDSEEPRGGPEGASPAGDGASEVVIGADEIALNRPPEDFRPTPTAIDGLIDQLERLAALRREGLLTDDEYRTAKARILA